MCGIAGVFGQSDPRHMAPLLNKMLDTIEHRGPDGRGVEVFQNAALGHVRLSIIDLSGGAQPMSTADGRFTVVYNGEIYNYREIRKTLESKGHRFLTESDTEVILKSYQQDGIASFNKFRGMFAFAIWDNDAQEGLLVRDRFGIKPLFYCVENSRLVFASEIKGILPGVSNRPSLNLTSLHALMNFRYIPGHCTLFESIKHLGPGNYIKWSNGSYCEGKWADEISVASADLASIRNSLEKAVHRQLVSDVPLGGYLSGGLDSSTLLHLVKQERNISGEQYPTFTIQTGDSPLEAQQAAETAAYYAAANFQEPINYNIAEMLPQVIYHLEVPKVNALQVAMLARMASKHVKVALSGLGGDEIFLGYKIHQMLAVLDLWCSQPARSVARTVGCFGKLLLKPMGLHFDEGRRFSQILSGLPNMTLAYGVLRNVWDSPALRKQVYGPRLLEAKLNDIPDFLSSIWPSERDPVLAAAKFEFREKMVNDLLLQEDRLSMAYGLEVRVPFLDEDLIAQVRAIDRRLLMTGKETKGLMRQVVSPWLPGNVVHRAKSGFQVPVHLFFNKHLRPLCEELLSCERLIDDGLFNPAFVARVLSARPHKRLRWHYFMLYLMMGVTLWLDIFQKDREISPLK